MQEKVNYLLKMINKKIKETEQKEISNSKIFKIRNVDDFMN